jgi:hypothetical protein
MLNMGYREEIFYFGHLDVKNVLCCVKVGLVGFGQPGPGVGRVF